TTATARHGSASRMAVMRSLAAPGSNEWRAEMAIKLHRCRNVFVKVAGHPCWKVQSALDEQGIEYELVKMPVMRWNREETEKATGQRKYPWIEFEDGSIYREESQDMARRIKEGKLNEAPRMQPAR